MPLPVCHLQVWPWYQKYTPGMTCNWKCADSFLKTQLFWPHLLHVWEGDCFIHLVMILGQYPQERKKIIWKFLTPYLNLQMPYTDLDCKSIWDVFDEPTDRNLQKWQISHVWWHAHWINHVPVIWHTFENVAKRFKS